MHIAILLATLAFTACSILASDVGGPSTPGSSSSRWNIQHLQAKRHDVIRRLQSAPRGLRARSSPSVCETTRDIQGQCCSSTLLDSQGACCPPSQIYQPFCSDTECCENGLVFITKKDIIGYEVEETNCCIFPGVVYTNNNSDAFCCPAGMQVVDNECIDPATEPDPCSGNFNKRAPCGIRKRSFMTKRSENHPRVLLSSDLVVEHLLNDGKFTYNGQEHIDHSYQAANQGVFRRLAARGVTKAMKFAFRSSTQEHVKRNGLTWDDFPYLTISDGYEFAAEDVPEIYARLMARSDFDGFHWRGGLFDRELLHRLVRKHPAYNETLVDVYKQELA